MASMASTANMVAIRSIPLMSRVDFHTHLLPAIDDGSQSESQSYRMLQLEAANGVTTVLATPHFYPDGPTPSEFTRNRQASFERLQEYAIIKGVEGLPKIRFAAEVLLGYETADLKDLRKLAIEGTNYIMLEMPYANWEDWVYEAVERIQVQHDLIPIIAHVERYVPMHRDTEQILRLMRIPHVLGQMNTRSLLDRRSSRLCQRMIACEMVHVLGSDAHRGQHLKEVLKAYEWVDKKCGVGKAAQLDKNAQRILDGEQLTKLEPHPFKRLLGNIYR